MKNVSSVAFKQLGFGVVGVSCSMLQAFTPRGNTEIQTLKSHGWYPEATVLAGRA